MLAAMPTFEEFDGDLPQTGFNHTFLERIAEYSRQANSLVLDNFSAGGATVPLGCISEVVSFLSRLMIWVMQTYSELQKVSPGGSIDNWKYVCHCVRVVFKVLYEARWIGSGKTIQEARNILAKGFSAHPVVANVLNVHMQKQSMMRGEHIKIQANMDKSVAIC